MLSLHTAIPLNFHILNNTVHQIIQTEILDQADLVFLLNTIPELKLLFFKERICYSEFPHFHIKVLFTRLKKVAISTIMRR